MKIGVLCIGDELLKGAVVNTNLAYMGQKLLELGIVPEFSLEVPDRPGDVVRGLEFAMRCADFIITSGGLGPTADDLTKPSIAEYLGYPLELCNEAAEAIKARWTTLRHAHGWGQSAQHSLPYHFLNQAYVPKGCRVLMNRFGTAPGIYIATRDGDRFPGKKIVMLPGPPSELHPMFDDQVLPIVRENLDEKIFSRLFHVSGVPESKVEEGMQPVIAAAPGLSVAYCAAPEFVKLFLSAPDSGILESASERVRAIFADSLLSDGSRTVAEEVVRLLARAGHKLATAESCTGGLIASLITEIPGASEVYLGSVVSYANEVKAGALGVRDATLRTAGAVSADCAAEMLDGVCGKLGAECGISVTGIAGPGGGTPEKPVGLVYIGVRYLDRVRITENRFRGSREQIRARTAAVALNTLRRFILGLN